MLMVCCKAAFSNGFPRAAHHIKKICQVVDRIEPERQQLLSVEQMAQIGP